jgi:hypothetical protein
MKKFVFVNPRAWILSFTFLFVATIVPTFYISLILNIKTGIIFFIVSFFSPFFIKIILGFYKIGKKGSEGILLVKNKKYFFEKGKIYFFFFAKRKEKIIILEEKFIEQKDIEISDEFSFSFSIPFYISNLEKFYIFYKAKKFSEFSKFTEYLESFFSNFFKDNFFKEFGIDSFILRNFVITKKDGEFQGPPNFDKAFLSLISDREKLIGLSIREIYFEVSERVN